MASLSIPEYLAGDLAAVEQAVASRLEERSIVQQVATPFAFPANQPRIRAALVLMAAQCGTYQLANTLHAAAAVELIAVAANLHIGLVDIAARRRDQVGYWNGMQGNLSLMVGDYLLALAADEMAQAPDQRIIAFYSRAVMAFCEAALVSVQATEPALARTQYLESQGRATAALFEAATRAGAVCGGLDQESVNQLGRYGYAFGLAFHLHCDIHDFQSGAGASLRAGLPSLPLIYATTANRSQRIVVPDQPIQDQTQRAAVIEAVVAAGGVARTSTDVSIFVGQACAALAELPASPARGALTDLAEHLQL